MTTIGDFNDVLRQGVYHYGHHILILHTADGVYEFHADFVLGKTTFKFTPHTGAPTSEERGCAYLWRCAAP